jgi:hypothetical protein
MYISRVKNVCARFQVEAAQCEHMGVLKMQPSFVTVIDLGLKIAGHA